MMAGSRTVASERPRVALDVGLLAFAVVLALVGGARFSVWWAQHVGVADHGSWSSSPAWRFVLTIAGAVEVYLAASMVIRADPRPALMWTRRMLAVYLLVLVLGEALFRSFADRCGCFGPTLSLGLPLHVLLTGLLLGGAWALARGFEQPSTQCSS